MGTEDERAGRLLDVQASAIKLFDEVAARGVIAAGRGRAGSQRSGQGSGQRDVP